MTSLISPLTLKSWLHDGREIALLDVRERGQFGESHLFYAVSLPYSRLELEVARLAPRYAVRMVICDGGVDDSALARRAAVQLGAIGYPHVNVLAGGTRAWAASGLKLFAGENLPSKTFGELAERAYHTPHISALELSGMLQRQERVVVLDARPFAEFQKMSIPTATCCPNGELAYRVGELVRDSRTPIVINCAGRTRSIIGAQTLINLGLPNPIYALENGTQGWDLAGQTLEHGATRRYADGTGNFSLRAAAQAVAVRFGVPVVDAACVRTWAEDADRTLFLCDVRTPEEFASRSLPGAQHAPGGQLIQGTDQYVGVRGARIVLFDDDGVRAPTVASWLRQLGHDAFVLSGGLDSGLALSTSARRSPPPLATIDAAVLASRVSRGDVEVIDLRTSTRFRAQHIPQARWSIRPRLSASALPAGQSCVLVAEGSEQAAWVAATELQHLATAPLLLAGGMDDWIARGLPIQATPDQPSDADCIDYLFFVHDRHDGNKEAARRYLAWETGLVAQLDAEELATFRLPLPASKT